MQPKRVPVVSAKPAVPRRPGEFPPLSHLFFLPHPALQSRRWSVVDAPQEEQSVRETAGGGEVLSGHGNNGWNPSQQAVAFLLLREGKYPRWDGG